MDSRDASVPSRQPPQGLMMNPPFNFGQHLPNNTVMMGGAMVNPNFSFNSSGPKPFDAGFVGHQHHQQQNGTPASGVTAAVAPFGSEQGKKKRGRPRKYSPDGIGLGLSSNSQAASMAAGGGSGTGGQNELSIVNVERSQEKKRRGRPPGSGKKQLEALGGSGGVGFTTHVIKIPTGENIVSKVLEFSPEGPRTIWILSANGSVGDFTLKKPIVAGENKKPIVSGETFTHKGPFEIVSMSGSFCCMNSDGSRNDKINLTVSLARLDGSMLGGGVAGELIAVRDVEILAGSFIADRKKPNTSVQIASPCPTPLPHMLIGGSGSATPNNPTQLDAASDSSDDNGGGGVVGHSLNRTPGPYNNVSHPMQGMQMYQSHMDWGSSGMGVMHHTR